MDPRHTYDQTRGVYKCSYPKCTFVTPNLGAMRLHWRRRDHVDWLAGQGVATLPGDDASDPRTPAPAAAVKGGPCPDCGANKWRLLRSSSPVEAAAIRAGYKEVCGSCYEIR